MAKKLQRERRIQAALTQGYLILDKRRLLNLKDDQNEKPEAKKSKAVEQLYQKHIQKISGYNG